ncbi:MAG: hypothetical protein Q8N18_04850 [Opitutaceae bacterium]|nr:hypothetical protein [Opitutaceae bacterium]
MKPWAAFALMAAAFINQAFSQNSSPQVLDSPLRFSSIHELRQFVQRQREESFELSEAMGYFLVGIPPRDERFSEDERNRLIVSAADGLTPRQLMIIGYSVRIAELECALANEPKEQDGSLSIRAKFGGGQLAHLKALLRRLIVEKPNK